MAQMRLMVLVSLFWGCLGYYGQMTEDKDYNTCTIYQGGCMYSIEIKESNCMVKDDPNSIDAFQKAVEKAVEKEIDKKEIKTDTAKNNKADEEIPVKKLEHLEKKLTKMMEGLSVRSLRHIRQIRNDLRQMTTTMDLLKQQSSEGRRGGKKGKGSRGQQLGCPPEFLGLGTWNSCYRFSNFNTTWHEAREYCNAFGADLVALDTLKESYILDYLIKSNPDFSVPVGFWTSGHYLPRTGKWMWSDRYNVDPIKFMRWATGKPSARSTNHCLLMYKYAKYRWHDAQCTHRHNFICEIDYY